MTWNESDYERNQREQKQYQQWEHEAKLRNACAETNEHFMNCTGYGGAYSEDDYRLVRRIVGSAFGGIIFVLLLCQLPWALNLVLRLDEPLVKFAPLEHQLDRIGTKSFRGRFKIQLKSRIGNIDRMVVGLEKFDGGAENRYPVMVKRINIGVYRSDSEKHHCIGYPNIDLKPSDVGTFVQYLADAEIIPFSNIEDLGKQVQQKIETRNALAGTIYSDWDNEIVLEQASEKYQKKGILFFLEVKPVNRFTKVLGGVKPDGTDIEAGYTLNSANNSASCAL